MRVRHTRCVVDVIRPDAGLSCKRVASIAVIENPYAGESAGDLSALIAAGGELGLLLVEEALKHIPGVDMYGKGAIVGSAGELEHAAAVLHPEFGAPVRNAIGGGQSVIPSTARMGAIGASLDVPMHQVNDAFAVDYYDSIQAQSPFCPLSDEIVVVLALGHGPRPRARVPPPRKIVGGA